MTETSDPRPPEAQESKPVAPLAFAVLAVAAVAVFAYEAMPALQTALDRAAFPYADNQWSEPPLFLQLHRAALGQAAYLPTGLANSYDYGPLYLVVLRVLRALFAQPETIVAYRMLSMVIGTLTVVPLAWCAVTIAERGGLPRGALLGKLVAAVGAAALGLAVLARNITFDTLHPDNLAYLTIASALALHFGIAARRIPANAVWGLAALGIIAALGKQNAVVVVPLLLLGLGASGAISGRLALAAIVATVGGTLVAVAAMPADVRAWAVLVPLAQSYEFWPARIADCWRFLTDYDPYLATSYVPAAVMLVALGRRARRTLWADGAALLAVAIVAFTGYFKVLGIWNNLTVLMLVTVPYTGALLGLILGPKTYTRAQGAFASVALIAAFTLAATVHGGEKQIADAKIDQELQGVDAAAVELCATKGSILVTQLPDAFFGCPTAIYAPVASYGELQPAFPRYYKGPTIFDQPSDARYIVVSGAGPLPAAWAGAYHRKVKSLPVVAGWGGNYFPYELEVFEHD